MHATAPGRGDSILGRLRRCSSTFRRRVLPSRVLCRTRRGVDEHLDVERPRIPFFSGLVPVPPRAFVEHDVARDMHAVPDGVVDAVRR